MPRSQQFFAFFECIHVVFLLIAHVYGKRHDKTNTILHHVTFYLLCRVCEVWAVRPSRRRAANASVAFKIRQNNVRSYERWLCPIPADCELTEIIDASGDG